MPTNLHSALDVLGWSPRRLAAYLGIGDRTMRRAVRGEVPLPETAMDWLQYITEPIAGRPPFREVIEERLNNQPLPDGWGTGDLPLAPRQRLTPPVA
jgi:hypothetical protein